MGDKLHKTKGIVLKAVKYGDTSLVVTIFTRLFGLQSYLVNGVRTSSKKGMGRANLFQPAAILDLVVYHNELKQLNRIKEFKWSSIYENIFSDVPRNAVSAYFVELLTKCLKQPETNEDLFDFSEDILLTLDTCTQSTISNLPLFVSLHTPFFFGFRIDDNYSSTRSILDLQEGSFVSVKPDHPYFLEEQQASICESILKGQQPAELESLRLNGSTRRNLLLQLENYYRLHVPEFGSMKTLPVLHEVVG
jgi:DNA repair protein RecO (recombination protein O)